MDLKDKVAIVTGGGTGLGKATSLAMAREGAHIAVIYSRSEADAFSTAKEIEGLGVKAIVVKADVSNSKAVNAMVAKVMQELGRIDVLINNAAFSVLVPFNDLEGMKEEDWDRIMAVNAKGPFLCCKAVVPIMKKQGAGRILSIGTTAAARPAGSNIAYAASKAALNHLSACLAKALAPEITVNVVSPGGMPTRWWSHLTGEPITEERKRKTIEGNPLKRYSELEDVAAAILMVVKNDSMTGEVVKVDAGLCLVT